MENLHWRSQIENSLNSSELAKLLARSVDEFKRVERIWLKEDDY